MGFELDVSGACSSRRIDVSRYVEAGPKRRRAEVSALRACAFRSIPVSECAIARSISSAARP
jgi:hypothetical protein